MGLTDTKLLAGLTVSTVLMLKLSDADSLSITHAGPTEDGKYIGWIITKEGRPLIHANTTFDSATDAEEHMHKVIAAARAWEQS